MDSIVDEGSYFGNVRLRDIQTDTEDIYSRVTCVSVTMRSLFFAMNVTEKRVAENQGEEEGAESIFPLS